MPKKIIPILFTLLLGSAILVAVNADIGSGVLYVYTDNWGGTEAPKDAQGKYLVLVGQTYYLRITGITEFDVDDQLTIKIGWTDTDGNSQTTWISPIPVQTGGVADFEWTIPLNAQVCLTCTVHYRGDKGPDYVCGQLTGPPGHMHVIPENPLGTIGSILALFLGFAILQRKIHRKLP